MTAAYRVAFNIKILGICEAYKFQITVVRLYMTTSSALWSRRRLVPVLWGLMRPLRATGSASVPAVVMCSLHNVTCENRSFVNANIKI